MNASKNYAEMLRKLYIHNKQKFATKGINLFIERSTEFDKDALDLEESERISAKYFCKPKMCYWNCIYVASKEKDLTYYEGYAAAFIPMNHAWLVTKDGRVVEPTLVTLTKVPPIIEYFGMPIPIELAKKTNREFCPAWIDLFAEGGELIEEKEEAKE